MKPFLPVILVFLFISCNNGTDSPDSPNSPNIGPKRFSVSPVKIYPHDTSSFTEGLLFYKGELYEGTGEKGKSRIMKVDLNTGRALKSVDLDAQYFGEGIVIVNDTIYQLTYQEEVGFMYSLKDFKQIGRFTYASKEGWGMTYDGTHIIASDGSNNLYYYQPGTFKLVKTLRVSEAGAHSFNINELEYIDGFIYANQWQYSYILKIDPASGEVVGKADLSDITSRVKANYPYADFLNGIAYDDSTKKIYITGKKWPELYEVRFSE